MRKGISKRLACLVALITVTTNSVAFAQEIKKAIAVKRDLPLSPVSMEVLAIIAYNQAPALIHLLKVKIKE